MSANRNARASAFVILGAGVRISAGTGPCGSFLQGEIHRLKAHVEMQRQNGVNLQRSTGDELKTGHPEGRKDGETA